MSQLLKFTYIGYDKDYYPPLPARKALPDWYKDLDEYIGGVKSVKNGLANNTGKKCVPMFDVMTAGYVFRTQVDLWVERNEKGDVLYNWAADDLIHFHLGDQLNTFPSANGVEKIPKMLNPYLIETPKGYSTLFMPPANHDCPLQVFSGIVDTDTYIDAVNYPFLAKPGFEGLVKAGTPFVQMIPIKRESWKHTFLERKEMDQKRNDQTKRIRSSFFRAYRDYFWHKKEYL